MKRATLVLIFALWSTGMWILGAGKGYERGKHDASANLRINSIVLLHPNGMCSVAKEAHDVNGTAEVSLLVRTVE